MSQQQPDTDVDQAARERAMGLVSDVLLNIEYALAKARKSQKVVAKDGAHGNAELALAEAARDLEKVRKRLMQDTYFAVDDRLI
jgi:hypothetical protein